MLHGAEVDEHPLRGLGPEVDRVVVIGHRSHVRSEHQVELARIGERMVAAVRTRLRVAGQVVLAVALMAVEALDQRVVEDLQVPARLPHAGRHDHGSVQAHHVIAQLHHRSPPRVADVALQLDAEGAVVPRRTETSVDLRRLEGDPSALGEGRDLVHQIGHGPDSLPGRWERPLAWERC